MRATSFLLGFGLCASTQAIAGPSLDLDFGGTIQSDIRFRITPLSAGHWYAPATVPPGIARNQNLFKARLRAKMSKVTAVADVDLVFTGYPREVLDISDLSRPEKVEPFRITPHALYVEARDVPFRGLTLRIGQQKAQLGVGDQFNPTNTLNPNNVEDPLLFGEQAANLMVRADYGYKSFTLTGVLIPVFKPAMLPDSAPLGMLDTNRTPFVNDELRWRILAEQAAAADVFGFPTVVAGVHPETPAFEAENMQFAFRVGGNLGGQDLSLSYYRGFSDVPVPVHNHTTQVVGEQCNRGLVESCIDGVLLTEVTLNYPRVQVIGLNATGEAPIFGNKIAPIGYRLEAALTIPQRTEIKLTNDEIDFGFVTQPAGEYDYPDGGRPAVLLGKPYAKWVFGLDYTLGKHLYLNAQWVHGFFDELGAGDWIQKGMVARGGGVTTSGADTSGCAFAQDGTQCAFERLKPNLGDYLVLGSDLRFASNRGLIRLFLIWDLIGVYEEHWDVDAEKRVRTHYGPFTGDGFAGVIYPEVNWNFGNGFDLGAGVLLQLGKDWSKFGDPSAGGSLVWTRARFSF